MSLRPPTGTGRTRWRPSEPLLATEAQRHRADFQSKKFPHSAFEMEFKKGFISVSLYY